MRILGVAVLVVFAAAALNAQTLTVTTFAGPRENPAAIDATGTAARLNSPYGVAVDSGGNVYFAEYYANYTVRKASPAGVLSTLAGLAGVEGTADGTGAAASFSHSFGIAVDNSGNVYVAEYSKHCIRRITQSGVVTTFAGLSGHPGSSNGSGGIARFYNPTGVATDSGGNVYVADSTNNMIRKITPAGVTSTFAGDGIGGSTDSPPRFQSPYGVAVDSSDNVWVADTGNNTIRKITQAGVTSTFAGSPGQTGSTDATGSSARFNGLSGLAFDASGNLFVADTLNHTIRKVTTGAVVTTVAGLAGNSGMINATGTAARFNTPYSVAVDGSGNIYVADTGNISLIRKVTQAGVVTTFLGGWSGTGKDDGASNEARFYYPAGVAAASGGIVYVADQFNHTIRKISSGNVTTFAGLAGSFGTANGSGSTARFYMPNGVATDNSGNVYVADTYAHTIRAITSAGAVTTLAGNPGLFGSTDGTGTGAKFKKPRGITVDNSGNIYVADTENNTIRKVTTGGVVTTLAGLAGAFGSTDATGSAARFSAPVGVACDSGGNVYVADTDNHTVRKITPAGVVTTLAGLAGSSGSTNGNGSNARFYYPRGVAVDGSDNIYVADGTNHTIRRITQAGDVTTVAGTALQVSNIDATGAAAGLYFPQGMDFDSSGNLYIADTTNHNIRLAVPAISDVATIDSATGAVGVARQLDTTPQTASSWQWSFIRRPANSTATFSSSTSRNPTFTPDIEGLWTFRLVATYASGTTSSITMVSLTSTSAVTLPAPTGLVATASGTTSVGLTWNAASGATSYDVYRSMGASAYGFVTNTASTSFTDNGVPAGTTALYKVRAVASGSTSPFSAIDAATTIVFTDDPLIAGTTARAAHFTELRTAIYAMRIAAGMSTAPYSNPIDVGGTILARDITEMRSALDAARSAIGLPALTYTDNSMTTGSTLIKAAHIIDLRNGVK